MIRVRVASKPKSFKRPASIVVLESNILPSTGELSGVRSSSPVEKMAIRGFCFRRKENIRSW